ncbi:hypothetical protein [Emergencia timonensis]|nr:hypothetical protein [Emergencia timonensis]
MNQAMEVFRFKFPDRTPEVLNCAGCYTQAQFERTGMKQNGNRGSYCYDVIRREDYI